MAEEIEVVECGICLEAIHPPLAIWIEPRCGKIWHYECMREWYKNTSPKKANEPPPEGWPPTCPVCKAAIPVIENYASSPVFEAKGGYTSAQWMFQKVLKSGCICSEIWRPLSVQNINNHIGVGSDEGIDLFYSVLHGPPDQVAWIVSRHLYEARLNHHSVAFAPVDWTPDLLPNNKGKFDLPGLDNLSVPSIMALERGGEWPFDYPPQVCEVADVYNVPKIFGKFQPKEPVTVRRFLYRITPQLIANAVARDDGIERELQQVTLNVPEGQEMWVQVAREPIKHLQWRDYWMVPLGETPTFDDGRQNPNMGLC